MPRLTRSRESLARLVAGGGLAAAGATALIRFGGTQETVLYLVALWMTLGVLAVCAGLRADDLSARWLSLALVGAGLMILIWAQPTLEAQGYVAAYLSWSGLTLALFASRGNRRAQLAILVAMVLMGAAEALYGFAQALGGVDRIGSYERRIGAIATGTFINRNHFAALLNMSLACLFGMLYGGFSARRRNAARFEAAAWGWLAVLGGAGLGVAVFLSQSRGGALTMIATLALMTALVGWRSRKRRRSGLPARAGLVLLVVTLALGSIVGVDALLTRFAETSSFNRLPIYRDSLELVADHPWLGVGAGMYEWRFLPYQTVVLDRRFSHAHNDYLETAAEWGVPLALLAFGFLFWRTVRAGRAFFDSRDPRRQGIALGCTGALFSVLLHSLVEFNLQIPALSIAFWALVGLAWGAETDRPERRVLEARTARAARAAGRVLIRVVLPALLLLAASRLVPRWLATRIAHVDSTVSGLGRAVQWDEGNPRLWAELARGLRETDVEADLASSLEAWRRALELNPHNRRYWNDASRAFRAAGLEAEEEEAMQRALALNSRDGRYQWRLADLYLRRGELEAARPLLGSALRADPARMAEAVERLIDADATPEYLDRAWPRPTGARLELIRLVIDAWEPEPRRAMRLFLDAEWRRLVASPDPPGIDEGRFYFRHLLAAGRPRKARQRWLELTRRHGLSDPAFGVDRNLVWNGAFELEATGSPLDWSYGEARGMIVARREGMGVGSSTALEIAFDGSENLSFSHVRQLLVVEPGSAHELSFSVRTEEVTTDEGVRVVIGDPESGSVLCSTRMVLGTAEWTRVREAFEVPEGTPTVLLTVRRRPSLKIDSKVAGTVWLDDVAIRARPPGTG